MWVRTETVATVRKTATGSLIPDSTSSVALTRSLRRAPRCGERAGDRRGEDDADRRQRQGRGERQLEACPVRAHPAVEQDEAERGAADEIGGADVLEDDAAAMVLAEDDGAETFLADQHAEAEEDEEHRRADAAREPAGEDAGQ